MILDFVFYNIIMQTPLIPFNQSSSPESKVLLTLLDAVRQIAVALQHSPVVQLESMNKFGDQQLRQDIHTDQIVQKHLRKCPNVKGFASEERPHYMNIQRQGQNEQNSQQNSYIVTYDPLDGSSIIDCNFAVGSIFSIWPYTHSGLQGAKVSSQVNAMVAVYGPRTTVIVYNSVEKKVQELTLIQQQWHLSHDHLEIGNKAKMYSPGNLRAITQHIGYRQIVHKWLQRGLTLRYTGGLVPDIVQIFIKRNGIFANVASKSHKSKLRVLYQVAAVAFLIEKAGGATVTDGKKSVLQYQIQTYDDRMQFGAGSKDDVQIVAGIF